MLARRVRHSVRCKAALFSLGLVLIAAPAIVSLGTPMAMAQQAAARVVQGHVQAADGSSVKGAIVYLKNAKTLEVRTYISTDDGSYRFGQLSSDANYTVWADYQGRKSKEKGVSAFDNKKVFDITLKLEG